MVDIFMECINSFPIYFWITTTFVFNQSTGTETMMEFFFPDSQRIIVFYNINQNESKSEWVVLIKWCWTSLLLFIVWLLQFWKQLNLPDPEKDEIVWNVLMGMFVPFRLYTNPPKCWSNDPKKNLPEIGNYSLCHFWLGSSVRAIRYVLPNIMRDDARLVLSAQRAMFHTLLYLNGLRCLPCEI